MIALRLSIMMFIQFFLWGSWYVTAYLYLSRLGFGGEQIGWTYSVGPIAGMISPFFVGMIADRFFSTERVLGVLHLGGAAAMYGAVQVMQGTEPSATVINLLFFVHMLCYFPTLALTNSLALQTMTNPEKQFPLIRVFGTIGWIAAGQVVSFYGWDQEIYIFTMAAVTGVVMGLYSFTLPHTPPPSAGKQVSLREVFGLDALVMLKNPSFLTFMVASFLVCIPLAFYYQMAGKFVDATGFANPASVMSYGQMSEIIFMLVMPLFFARLGVKWMLFVGMLAWVARYGLFAVAADDAVRWMVLVGIILHGICYDFFFVTGQIYTDKTAPPSIRGQAQGMLVLFTLGLGMFIGAQVAGRVEAHYTASNNAELTADAETIATAIKSKSEAEAQASPAEKEAIASEIADLRKSRSVLLLQAVDWKTVWAIPAGGAAAIMVLFAIFFKDNSAPKITEEEVANGAASEMNP